MLQKIPDSPCDLRPDLVVLNNETNTAVIEDVTIPIEASPLSFTTAGDEKLHKYAPLVEWLTEKGYKVSSHAFIVGALGAWHMPICSTCPLAVHAYCHYSKLFSHYTLNCSVSRGVEIQCQWHQLSGVKSELGTTGLGIGNVLLSTSLKLLVKRRPLINFLARASVRCHTNQYELSGSKKFALDTTQDLLAPPVAP